MTNDRLKDIKFYYIESLDDYWIGGIYVDNCYYACWDGHRFVWQWSKHLPWGQHIVDPNTLWKEYTYPSEPVEIDFLKWFDGFLKIRMEIDNDNNDTRTVNRNSREVE